MSSSQHSQYEDGSSSDDNMHGNGTSENNAKAKRKGRGRNKPNWGKKGKEKIEFRKDGSCIDPKDAQLSRYLGFLAMNYDLIPLSPKDWRTYKDNDLDKMWKAIFDTIDWREEDIPRIPIIRHTLLHRLSERVRKNKGYLKETYYTPHIGSPSRFICGDDSVPSEQWTEMVNYWDNDPSNKNKVEKNIESRKKLKMNHTGGTKTFARHLAEFEQKNGRPADPIEGFDLIHKRKGKQKSWIDDASAQMGAKISNELTQLVAIHGEETPQLRLQAYVNARGVDSGGRVRGYGEIVTPDMMQLVNQTEPTPSIRRSRKGRVYASLESDFLVLQSKCAQQQEVNEKQQKDIEELRQIILSSRHQSLNPQLENSPSENRSSSLHHSLHSQPEESPTRQRSPTQHRSSSQSAPSYHRSPSSSSHQHLPYSQPPPYHYPPSSQFYYPQPYRQPLYTGYHPNGEFTAMLNDPDFMQRFMHSDKRNDQRD